MVAFDRLQFVYLRCPQCMLIPDKRCGACAGCGLVIRRPDVTRRPAPASVQEMLARLAQWCEDEIGEAENARRIGDTSMLLAGQGRLSAFAQAGAMMQSFLAQAHLLADPMPRGKGGCECVCEGR